MQKSPKSRIQRGTEVQKYRRVQKSTEEYRLYYIRKKVEYSRVEGSGKVRGVVAGKIQQAGWLQSVLQTVLQQYISTAVDPSICTGVMQ